MEYNEKQQMIINEAEKLFAVKGFEGTSVRDIALAAGVNVAMISYYFGSKENLLAALFGQRRINLAITIENLLQDEQQTHLEKVYILIDDFVQRFVKQQRFHKIMMCEQMREDNVVSKYIRELKTNNLDSIKKLINAGQKAGEFKKNIDIMMMMWTMAGTVSQAVTSQWLYKEINGLEKMPEEEYQKHIQKKLTIHLKNLFKKTLTNEKL
jgi:AcrR family transcriptional regulator